MTDTRKLREVFLQEYQATRGDIDAAVAAVATAVTAQLRLPFDRPPSVTLNVTVVQYQPPRPKAPPTLIDQVVAMAAAEVGCEPRHVRGSSRADLHVAGRRVALAVLREMGLSLPACGRAVGLRNHTSVLHALRAIQHRPDLLAAAARVSARVHAEPRAVAAVGRATSIAAVEAA
jgi:hypothetical protein